MNYPEVLPLAALKQFLIDGVYSMVYVLTDDNTKLHCYPLVEPLLGNHVVITIPAGEQYKTLNTCASVWQQLTQYEADRNALLLNLGGGMVGDLGGFAAGCYKRGINFANIPTSLLAMVDAGVGAKTGIDFSGYKNQIGLFNAPKIIFLHTDFLRTLPEREFKSGMAEVIKHALIADADLWKSLPQKFELQQIPDITDLVHRNIAIKTTFVSADPLEKGIRQALNFGHTIGHAVESWSLTTPTPLLHGEAIVSGIIAESYLSVKAGLLSEDERNQIVKLICNNYQLPPIQTAHYHDILRFIKNDKKNKNGNIRCCYLNGIGNYSLSHSISESDIFNALDYYNRTVT